MIEFLFYTALVILYVYLIQPPHKQAKLRLFGWICLIAAPIWIPAILIFSGLFAYLLLFILGDPGLILPILSGFALIGLVFFTINYLEKKVILYLNKKFPSKCASKHLSGDC